MKDKTNANFPPPIIDAMLNYTETLFRRKEKVGVTLFVFAQPMNSSGDHSKANYFSRLGGGGGERFLPSCPSLVRVFFLFFLPTHYMFLGTEDRPLASFHTWLWLEWRFAFLSFAIPLFAATTVASAATASALMTSAAFSLIM